MSLKLAGEEIGIQEKVEVISYNPDIQDSGDLEAATSTVTATSKQAEADYADSLTAPAPSDNRFVVKRIGVRMQLTVDSLTGGHLYGSIYVNGSERKTFDITATGDNFLVVDLIEGQFNLGSANSYQVYLWVDEGQAVISACRLWQAVGSTQQTWSYPICLQIVFGGLVQLCAEANKVGTSNIEATVSASEGVGRPYVWNEQTSSYLKIKPSLVLWQNNGIAFRPLYEGDLDYFYGPIIATLRSLV